MYSTFQDTREEFAAVNRGDLQILNYTKTVFDRGSASDPAGGSQRSSYPLVGYSFSFSRSHPPELVLPLFLVTTDH